MEPKKITALAKLLRDNGDKVLSSEFKLNLSGPLLRALNDSFRVIVDHTDLSAPQAFQVVIPSNAKSDVYRDLQLVHDFVQKTLLLCITHFPGDDFFEGPIDISKFRGLRRLEVRKVNIKQIVGIQPLRAQLEHLMCIRSLDSVEDIITYCGGDHANGFVWNELKIADFSYNNLKCVDSSLEFAQWLQHLNLSHNQLTSVEAIKWLPNLKQLDLSFNRLAVIPNFHTEASRRLQILILRNNFIENLSGLSRLDALAELDLSDNCLLDHQMLLPISTLVALRYLNLSGNPLFCHPKHRQVTSRYLNKNTASVKFILDFNALTKKEKTLVGITQYVNPSYASRLSLNVRSSGQSTPVSKLSQAETPASSVGSIRNFTLNGPCNNEMTDSIIEKQKKLKVRTVEIEDVNTNKSNTSNAGDMLASNDNISKLEGSNEHLKMKKQIETLRKKFGADWLQSENAEMVHRVLGIKISDEVRDNKLTSQKMVDDLLGQMNISQTSSGEPTKEDLVAATSTPVEKDKNFEFSTGNITQINKNEESKYESIVLDKTVNETQTVYQTAKEEVTDNIDDIYPASAEDTEVSDPEDNELTYIVHSKDNIDELFLTVSNTWIKERDALNRRTRAKWTLRILESCDRINSNTLRINFDTIKKDRKERIYTVEEGCCHELEKNLRDILSNRQLSEMNQTLYRCVKCSCQFSRENIYQKRFEAEIVCPDCNGTFIVEVHETPKNDSPSQTKNILHKAPLIPSLTTSALQREAAAGEKYVIEESASHSSIGSAGSLNESSSCSKISNSESSFDSNQSVAGSSANDKDIDISLNRNCESDVEILSNPSQSSIEVLDNIHSSRKTSEERRISRIPSLETIEDQSLRNAFGLTLVSKETSTDESQNIVADIKDNLISDNDKKTSLGPINLTESSSSGSVTDSICTAYEQTEKSSDSVQSGEMKFIQNKGSIEKDKVKEKNLENEKNSDKENKDKKEDSIISSMFGGLFQSTNLLMSRSNKPDQMQQCEKFKYNYKNFSDVDHRLKYYFYQMKFEDENEDFKWLVKGKILNEIASELSEGIIVMSTTKIYIMQVIAQENDDISKWLKQIYSGTLDKIEAVNLLPWKIGFAFKIKGWGSFILLLQDDTRTDSFLMYFASDPHPLNWTADDKIADKVIKSIPYSAVDEQLKMFSILNTTEIIVDNNTKSLAPSAFLTTDTHLYLTSNVSWLLSNSDNDIQINYTQVMSNLVEVDRPSKNIFSINFLDETQDKCELWKCYFETKENAESCLNAIGQSWEKLFGVPLINN